MMKKLTVVLILISLVLCSVFAGGKQEAPVVEETKPEGTVEVVWWTFHGATNVGYFQKLLMHVMKPV